MKRVAGVMAVCLLFATACQQAEITRQTFVNQHHTDQILKLESQTSQHVTLLGRFHGVDSVGSYTMTTDTGTIRGTYTYVSSSKGERGYIFHPESGARWEVTLSEDGAFTDGNGDLWRLKEIVVDQSPQMAEKHLVRVGS